MRFSARALTRAHHRLWLPDDRGHDGCLASPSPLMPWLAVEQFTYALLEDHSAALQLLARVDPQLGAPAGAMLVIRNGSSGKAHHAASATALSDGAADGLLWRASFAVPLDVVEYPRAAFMLIADHRVAIALPVPARTLDAIASAAPVHGSKRFPGARIRRHFLALGAGLAITAGAGSAGAAAAGAITGQPAFAATTTTVPQQSTTAPVSTSPPTGTTAQETTTAAAGTTAPTLTTTVPVSPTAPILPTTPTTTSAPASPTTSTTTTPAPAPSVTGPAGTPAVTPPPTRHCDAAPPATNLSSRASPENCPAPASSRSHHGAHIGHDQHHSHGGDRGHRSSDPNARGTGGKQVHHHGSTPDGLKDQPTTEHAHSSHDHSIPSGGTAPERGPAAPGAPEAPATTVAGAGFPVVASPWTIGLNPDPVASAQLSRISSLLAGGNQPPLFLIPIYKAAGRRYHVPWKVLAAINSIETDFGRNLSVSSAGAVGWMQFMPGTWRMYAVAADGRGRPNPYNPTDAIFTTARYLAANGARHNLRRAIFAYNHADWYVQAVLLKAQAIADRVTSLRHSKGYSLPLAPRYMHQLGRTDDGVDIETAPDGALVYSITPGLVTAVADDPGGFGPNYPVIVATKGPLTGKAIYYGHVALSLVRPGQQVSAGQPIAVMGHTGDAASLGHGHIEIGFSNPGGDPLDHHGAQASTPAGGVMRQFLVELSALYGIRNS